jgi:uncharacterized protein YukE
MTDTTTPPPAEETPVTPDPADGARWRGYTHKELYLMLHDGPGASSSAAPSRRWQELSTTLTEIGEDLKKALDQTGSGWQGKAAGAAYDRLSTTVSWANGAGANAGLMRTAVEDQGDHIAKARADMPAPEGVTPVAPDPTIAPAVQVLQTQVDAEPAEAGSSSAEERAVEVMTAYENNSKTTTASLAGFDMPQKLLPETGMHQGQGGGLLGILPTVVSGLLPGGGPSRHDHHHSDWRGPKDNWHGPSTNGSSAPWEERRPLPAAPAPGKTMGVAREPLLAPRIMSSNGGANEERTANKTPANGSSSGHGPLPQKASPAANVNLPHGGDQQFQQAQAAAASQAAASAHPGAGAPIAPTAGAVGGGQEKLALRRFGMDAIGSSQWFGDSEEPAVGESPKRRFDLRESVDVTESVSILDEEHKLPPTVIGDGGR